MVGPAAIVGESCRQGLGVRISTSVLEWMSNNLGNV